MTSTIPERAADGSVVTVSLHPTLRTPWVVRRVVGALIDNGPRLRCIDASLLAGELATLLVEANTEFTLRLAEAGRAIRVEVATESAIPQPDPIAQRMLERVADRWATDTQVLWFEIDLIRAKDLADLPDEELFALVPDDREARDELFDRYVNFASAISRRYGSRSRAGDDLEQVAHFGLVQALERFDTSVGVKFTTFASRWISGVIKRYLRDHSWSMRVPRGLKNAALDVTRTRAELSQRLGRDPTDAELAASMDVTVDELREAMLAGDTYTLTSLDSPVGEDGSDTIGGLIGGDDPDLIIAEQWPEIEAVLDRLDDREQQILYLRYFEDLTQSEIAPIVGVSQVHVSRLLKRSLETVRDLLEDQETAGD